MEDFLGGGYDINGKRMERHAGKIKDMFSFWSIERIMNDWMPDRFHMDANLVGTSRFGIGFDIGCSFSPFQYFV